MILRYQSGEEIKEGDKILFHRHVAAIELVVTDGNEPEKAWHWKEFGGGVLIHDPAVSGRTFIPADSIPDYEDLKFVARAEPE